MQKQNNAYSQITKSTIKLDVSANIKLKTTTTKLLKTSNYHPKFLQSHRHLSPIPQYCKGTILSVAYLQLTTSVLCINAQQLLIF